MRQRLISLSRTGGCIALALAGLLFVALPARAIFGIGDVVFDPSAYATLGSIWSQNASTYAKIIQEYNQLVKIYTTNTQMYTQAMFMSQRITHPNRMMWMTLAQSRVNDLTQSRYGETAQWPSMLNGRPEWAESAWTSATLGLRPNSNLAGETVGSSANLAHVATVEAIDGSSQKCLAVLAEYNANTQVNATAYRALQNSQLDDSDATNSEIQQLNLINAAQSQAINEARGQGAVHACLVEQQILANKVQRDGVVGHLNFVTDAQGYFASEGKGWGGAAEALRTR